LHEFGHRLPIDTTYLQIILGSIVTRCPSLSLAPSALVQLDSACALFSKAAIGFKAEKVLVWTISLSLEK